MNLRALGGWWRLWVILSLIYLAATGASQYRGYPRHDPVLDKWSVPIATEQDRADFVRLAPTELLNSLAVGTTVLYLDDYLTLKSNLYDPEFEKQVTKMWAETRHKVLKQQQARWWKESAYQLISGPLYLALFGLCVGWVYRGFRKGKSHG